ncbi:hypothetical protein ACHQM5_012555 [Ranunculus cassubicifolius]
MKMLTLIFLHAIFLCCISLPSSTVLGLLGNETDKLSLLAFKSQITHDPLEVLSSWNDSSHFCEWGGVTCSHRHQRVTVLRLWGKSLVGPISPHIGNLSFLRTLSLPANNFYGEIPQEIGKLSRLELLELSNNSFVGKIPSNISFRSNLITLILSGNNFFGNLPMEFWSLPNLEVLAVANANLTGEIPPSLGNITSLKALALSDNHLGGIIPSTIGQLKLLYRLNLVVNNFSGMVPPPLYNLSSLRFLSITLNHLVGNLPSAIGLTLPNLERLFIGDNNFSGPIPHSLFNASKLQQVGIDQNHFTGKVPINVGNLNDLQYISLERNDLGTRSSGDLDFISSLTNCSNLEALSIAMNQFGGSLPPSVGNFSNKLERLSLRYNHIVGNIPSQIDRLQNLYLLSMGYNSFNGGIPAGFRNLQKLQALELADNQLSGNIPSFLNNMSQLFVLSLKNNFLEGSIASSLESQNLQYLDLSSNKFTGTIPKEIGLSSQLLNLSLAHNSLTGSIPLEVGNLKNLEYFGVSKNKMSSSVPNIFASLLSLQYLELEGNIFQGLLPSSLGSLQDLRSLDVSNNNFSGPIPKELEKLSVLTSLNLSFNNFEGEVPSQGIFKNVSAYSVTANHNICGGIPDLGLPICYVQKSRKRRNKLALTVTLGTIGTIIVVVIFIFIYLWRKPNKELSSESRGESFMRVSYHDLFQATNGFSMTNLVGTGRYGSVYKGILQQFERPVAVKVLNLMEAGASKTFLAECEALRAVRHRCLLKILTVCSSVDYNANDFKAIVFDFMDNGSLESWLHPTSDGQDSRRSLSLYQRLEVATSIASALDYLHNHCETPIAHCDLKPSNILLDDAMNAFVSDFGLAKFLAMTLSSSNGNETSSIAVRGTIGYIPPEYGMGSEVSTQGDVYSYGILLLEIFTGKRPTDHLFKDGLSLHDLCKTALVQGLMGVIDTRILSEETYYENADSGNQMRECLNSIIKIGVACSVDVMTERMDIKAVAKEMLSWKMKFVSNLKLARN